MNRKKSFCYYFMEKPPPFPFTSAHGNVPSSSNTFVNSKIVGKAPRTSNNGNTRNDNANAASTPLIFF